MSLLETFGHLEHFMAVSLKSDGEWWGVAA